MGSILQDYKYKIKYNSIIFILLSKFSKNNGRITLLSAGWYNEFMLCLVRLLFYIHFVGINNIMISQFLESYFCNNGKPSSKVDKLF